MSGHEHHTNGSNGTARAAEPDDAPPALRVAIVGAGPAGFYAAAQLLASAEPKFTVDLFDRLATPWGLVRAGVAPDHPKIKSVSRIYERTARLAGFRFHGNVEVGRDLSHEELAAHYHAVVYATGAAADRRLGIPGEDLLGSHAATDFVAWYNGHPDHSDREFDLSARRAVVVGNGNVALDVARMLALSPEELSLTDVADHALEALRTSSVEEIVVLGRRGPAQAAYTNPELRELADLADADIVVDSADIELDPHSRVFLDSDQATAGERRNVEIVADYAGRAPQGRHKRIVLRFLTSPVEIVGTEQVEAVEVVHNEIVPGEHGLRAQATDRSERIEAGLVFRCIGYRGSAIPGLGFDEGRATLHTDSGRVLDPTTHEPMSGVYAAGWIKRGPTGVIGTNKKCANDTVALLVADAVAGSLPQPAGEPAELLELLAERGVEVVDYAGWERIDEHERGLGEPLGRPRVKLVRTDALLQRASASRS